jgi:hypothetical protein
MNPPTANPTVVAAKSAWKLLFWMCVAAVVQELINQIPHVQLPVYIIPFIGAALKGAASWVATKIANGG